MAPAVPRLGSVKETWKPEYGSMAIHNLSIPSLNRMTTTISQLEQLMAASTETPGLEFKAAREQYDSTKLFRYCVGIANEGGGQFVTYLKPRVRLSLRSFPRLRKQASLRPTKGRVAHANSPDIYLFGHDGYLIDSHSAAQRKP